MPLLPEVDAQVAESLVSGEKGPAGNELPAEEVDQKLSYSEHGSVLEGKEAVADIQPEFWGATDQSDAVRHSAPDLVEAAMLAASETIAASTDGSGRNTPDAAELLTEEVSFRLTDVRRKRLEEVGFVWSAREGDKTSDQQVTRNSYDDQWDAMFARLTEYKAMYGNCLVPKRYKEDPKL